jgi:hypothetical protein
MLEYFAASLCRWERERVWEREKFIDSQQMTQGHSKYNASFG